MTYIYVLYTDKVIWRGKTCFYSTLHCSLKVSNAFYLHKKVSLLLQYIPFSPPPLVQCSSFIVTHCPFFVLSLNKFVQQGTISHFPSFILSKYITVYCFIAQLFNHFLFCCSELKYQLSLSLSLSRFHSFALHFFQCHAFWPPNSIASPCLS